MPILQKPVAFKALIDVFCAQIKKEKCDVIIGLDARGFLIGAPCALQLGLPFVPVRKQGKLPGDCHQVSYTLEYGEVQYSF